MQWTKLFPWLLAGLTFVMGYFWGEWRGVASAQEMDGSRGALRATSHSSRTQAQGDLRSRRQNILAKLTMSPRLSIVKDLALMEEIADDCEDSIRLMDAHELIVGTPRAELPDLFESTFLYGGGWDVDVAEMVVKRWAQFDPSGAIQGIENSPGLKKWALSHKDYLKAIACYELASTAPKEAVSLHNQLCKSTKPHIGSGLAHSAPIGLTMNLFQRIAQNDASVAFELAKTSMDPYDALEGCVFGAVQSGNVQEVISQLASLDADSDQWDEVMVQLIRVWPHYQVDQAREWFDKLDPKMREYWEFDFNESLEDAGFVDP